MLGMVLGMIIFIQTVVFLLLVFRFSINTPIFLKIYDETMRNFGKWSILFPTAFTSSNSLNLFCTTLLFHAINVLGVSLCW